MDILSYLAVGFFSLAMVYWLCNIYGSFRLLWEIPRLIDLPFSPPPQEEWPPFSILVPARNEATTLRSATTTLLQADYPALEIILINDRSTDSTGNIMEELAREDDRVRVVHITRLPESWIGKNHALHLGMENATGEWILMTDADVHFRRDTFQRALWYCRRKKLDHLSIAPEFYGAGFAIDSLLTGFLRLIGVGMRIWKVSDPHSSAFAGVGAFNLVRRRAFVETPGFPWLRMETADDLGVGLIMKQAGKSSEILLGHGCIGLHWYRNIQELKLGVEKSYASLAGASFSSMVVFLILIGCFEMAPFFAILFLAAVSFSGEGLSPLLLVASLLALGTFAFGIASNLLVSRWARRPLATVWGYFFLVPLGGLIMFRAAHLGKKRGGAQWRDTLYTEDELIRGKRVRLLPGGGTQKEKRAR
jgi:hypothetical protein